METSRSRIALLAFAVLAAGALWWASTDGAASPGDLGRAEAAAEEDATASALLASVGARASDASAPSDDAPSSVAVAATQGRAPAPEAASESPGPARPVMGVVSDARGLPIPGAEVRLSVSGVRPADSLGRSSFIPSGSRISRRTTGPDGGFTFEGSDARDGGTLTYGGGVLLRGELSAPVDPEATYQVLTVPDAELAPVTWSIRVEDGAGDPVAPEVVDLRSGGGEAGAHPRLPRAEDRVVQYGLVQQRVPPGRWILEIASPESLVELLEVVIPPESAGGTFESTVVLESLGLADADDLADGVDEDGRPWLDPADGLDVWLPEEGLLLALGENTRDRHFAATLRAPGGPVRAAQLYLDIEANSGMSSNDGIYLDPNARKESTWANRISSLTGGRWSGGMRRRIRVDLSRLPSAEGGTVDLLPALEDGRLTVVIQDDTVVHAARLRVVR